MIAIWILNGKKIEIGKVKILAKVYNICKFEIFMYYEFVIERICFMEIKALNIIYHHKMNL